MSGSSSRSYSSSYARTRRDLSGDKKALFARRERIERARETVDEKKSD